MSNADLFGTSPDARPSTQSPEQEDRRRSRAWRAAPASGSREEPAAAAATPLLTRGRQAFDLLLERYRRWRDETVASPRFQAWAARAWLTRGIARRDADRLFDLTAGFVYAQILEAVVALGVLEALREGPMDAGALAPRIGLVPERAEILLQGAAALGLTQRLRDGRHRLGRLGAAALGAPGVLPMIRHHKHFYADLADPVALLRGPGETALATFWPYVRGEHAVSDADAQVYSELMAASQSMVAQDTLDAVSLRGRRRLLDVGGGAGAFAEAAARRWPELEVRVLDLPAVAEAATARFEAAGLGMRAQAVGGDFLSAPLPKGADAVSLIRVLYDHTDETVAALLRRVFQALPPGGLLILSEPMAGGARPCKAGDGYFALYTLAMTTGQARSADRHRALLEAAGFMVDRPRRPARPFVTSTLTARKPST
ncbi:MAG: methyltransferase [Pseudomonadota bacterium]